MDMNLDICKLICELEYLVGKECYNPNSYDGWNGIEGREFRYPVWIPLKREDEVKPEKFHCNLNGNTWGIIKPEQDFTATAIRQLKYKFGSNELYIGIGLQNILEFLENRYDLDFNQLERNIKESAND